MRKLAMPLFAVLALACGGESGPDPVDISVMVNAAMGGTVSGGGGSLNIPAGALATDTTITLKTSEPTSSLPELTTIKGQVFEFGPDGTEFSTAATLTLPMNGTPSATERAVISWLNTTTSAWVDLATDISGTNVTASITHFTKFVVRFKGGYPDCSAFVACGGNPVGVWTIDGICAETTSNPFTEYCPEGTYEIDLSDSTGTVTIMSDNTYSVSFNVVGNVTIHMPASCASMFGLTSCSTFEMSIGTGASCTGDPATTGCDCTGTLTEQPDMESGTWSTSGNTITFDSDDPQETMPETMEYCVSGNTLRVHVVDEDMTATFVGHK